MYIGCLLSILRRCFCCCVFIVCFFAHRVLCRVIFCGISSLVIAFLKKRESWLFYSSSVMAVCVMCPFHIKFKLPTIVGILIFMTIENGIVCYSELENCLIDFILIFMKTTISRVT